MRSLLASLAAIALAAPAAPLAQPVSTTGGAGPDTYLELHLGGFLPRSSDFDDLDPGIALGGTFGARFTPNVSVELEVAYYRAAGTAGGVKDVLEAVPLTASLRLRLPLKVAELSAFAGGGIHFAHTSTDAGAGGYASDDDTAFGYHIGAAAAFNLSPTMRVGLEVRETLVDAEFDGVEADIGGLRLAATLGYDF